MNERERQKVLACLLMEGAHRGFAPLLRDLENDYALGHDKYPETLEEALQVLSLYAERPLYKAIMKKAKQNGKQDEETPQLSFAQMSKREKMKKGLCFNCGKPGHKAGDCTEDTDAEEDGQPPQQHFQASWMG